MRAFLYSFILLSVIAFTVGAVGFCILYYGLHWELTFGALPRMFTYQDEHPFQYIAVVAVPYGFFGAAWVTFLGKTVGISRWLGLTGMILCTTFVGSLLGGLLWELHDMEAGFFPNRDLMIAHFEQGALWGLETGPVLIALSLPLNLVSLAVGILAPIRLASWIRNQNTSP